MKDLKKQIEEFIKQNSGEIKLEDAYVKFKESDEIDIYSAINELHNKYKIVEDCEGTVVYVHDHEGLKKSADWMKV